MKQYKVLDLSYSDDPAQHLKEVRAFHEGDGWRLLSVVYAAGRWLYYLERGGFDAVLAKAAATGLALPEPVRRVEGGREGEVATAGADVTAEGVSVEVMSRQSPRLHADYRRATWRNTTPVDEAAGRVGLGLDLEGGEVVRVALDLDSALDIVATLAEALSARRRTAAGAGEEAEGEGGCSGRS